MGLERLGSSTDILSVYRRRRDSRVTSNAGDRTVSWSVYRASWLPGEVDGGLGGGADPDEDGHAALAVVRVLEADFVLADRKRQLADGRVPDLAAVDPDAGGRRGVDVEEALRQLDGERQRRGRAAPAPS